MNVLTNTSCRGAKKIIRQLHSSSSTAVSFMVDIKIPDRIERGPTDILRALEKTISRDSFTPHYKYYDDPYLIPISKYNQRHYALSLESGRKAGIWVHQEHANLFKQNIADPAIKKFLPPVTYTKKEQVSEEILLSTISEGKTLAALEIYNLLEENVSIKAKQYLLELLCFSNSSDLKTFTFQEERWYTFNEPVKKQCTWKEMEEINKLFNFLISQDAETAAAAYNTLICGKAKYLKAQDAWMLFLQCKEKKIPLNINAYNAIIKIIPFVKDSIQDTTSEAMKLIRDMYKEGIHPNVGTLNSALEIIYSLKSFEKAQKFTYSLLEEFKLLKIKPSLNSYCIILFLENQNNESLITILNDMLNVLEKDTIKLCDPKDINFFPIAMEIARKENDLIIGDKIHALLLKDNNYRFIATAHSENIYYRYYTFLKLTMLPIKEFFEFYFKLTAHIYIPEINVMENILTTLQNHPKEILEYLPSLLSQIKMYQMLDNDQLIRIALDIASHCDIESGSPLHQEFATFALDICHFKQSKSSSIRQVIWNIVILKDMALVLLRASLHDKALEIISFIISNERFIMGTLNNNQINELLEICILQGYGYIALLLVQCAMESGLEETAMIARRIYNVIPLTADEKEKLISLVGSDVLQLKLSDQH